MLFCSLMPGGFHGLMMVKPAALRTIKTGIHANVTCLLASTEENLYFQP